MLNQLPFFADFSEQEMNLLRPLFTPCEHPADTVLFEQGAPAEFLYLVISGEVLVSYKPYDGPHMPVNQVGPGGVVGWSAVLGSRRYTSAALTISECQMLRVRGHDLRQLFRQQPRLGALIKDRLTQAIAQRGPTARAQASALLDIGLNSPNLPISREELST